MPALDPVTTARFPLNIPIPAPKWDKLKAMPPGPTMIAVPWLRPLSPADAFLPEGPREVKVAGREVLAWVNIQTGPTATTGAIHLAFAGGERRSLPQPGRPGFLVPTDRPNTVFVGMDQRLGLVDLATNQFEPLATLPNAPKRVLINDGEVVPGGSGVVFGTKDPAFKDDIAALYLWTAADNRVTVLKENQTCSNGKLFRWDKTGQYLLDIDSPAKKVVEYRFDLRERSLDRGRTVVSFADRGDVPDGMAGVGDGTFVVAFYHPSKGEDGEAVRVDRRSGKIVTKYRIPGSPRVTCPLVMYRPDGIKVLFTTADEGMPESIRASSPNAGVLFLADLGPRAGLKFGRTMPPNESVKLS
jgi:sugar lactone lactonase YvrE